MASFQVTSMQIYITGQSKLSAILLDLNCAKSADLANGIQRTLRHLGALVSVFGGGGYVLFRGVLI